MSFVVGDLLRFQLAIQRKLLLSGQRSAGSLRKFAQSQRTDGHAHQPEHFDSEGSQHAPYVPVLAFVEHDFEPAVFLSRAQQPGLRCAKQVAILTPDAGFDCPREFLIGDRSDLHVVGLTQVRLGSGDSCPPLGIVGQQKQSFAGLVQPSDGSDPGQRFTAAPQHGIHGLAAFFVRRRRHYSTRLVHHEINLLMRIKGTPIHRDAIPLQANRRLGITPHISVQPHSAGPNQLRSLRARAMSQLRQRASQADLAGCSLRRHAFMLPEVRRKAGFRLRTSDFRP